MILFQQNTSLLLVLAVIFFGFSVVVMPMDQEGNMSSCPFMNTAVTCSMGFYQHITILQSTFWAEPYKIVLMAAIVLFSLLILFPKTIPRFYSPPNSLIFFIKNILERFVADKFLIALSDGIIQPKLYA